MAYKVGYREINKNVNFLDYDIKTKWFQNKKNLIDFLKTIIKYDKDNIHIYDTYNNINIIHSIGNQQILIKWYGNTKNPYKNKNNDLFSYIHNNIYIASKVC